jgi:hypothetical protein
LLSLFIACSHGHSLLVSCLAIEGTAAVRTLWRSDTNVIGTGWCDAGELVRFFFRNRFVPFPASVGVLTGDRPRRGRFAFSRLPKHAELARRADRTFVLGS